mmetsp:Transcript_24558/g.68349  ORF Transcript_24558/g.68349 Transcript_24558/m.68349 type:complete len:205 (-) Transcript_24558:8-622(-)
MPQLPRRHRLHGCRQRSRWRELLRSLRFRRCLRSHRCYCCLRLGRARPTAAGSAPSRRAHWAPPIAGAAAPILAEPPEEFLQAVAAASIRRCLHTAGTLWAEMAQLPPPRTSRRVPYKRLRGGDGHRAARHDAGPWCCSAGAARPLETSHRRGWGSRQGPRRPSPTNRCSSLALSEHQATMSKGRWRRRRAAMLGGKQLGQSGP